MMAATARAPLAKLGQAAGDPGEALRAGAWP